MAHYVFLYCDIINSQASPNLSQSNPITNMIRDISTKIEYSLNARTAIFLFFLIAPLLCSVGKCHIIDDNTMSINGELFKANTGPNRSGRRILLTTTTSVTTFNPTVSPTPAPTTAPSSSPTEWFSTTSSSTEWVCHLFSGSQHCIFWMIHCVVHRFW